MGKARRPGGTGRARLSKIYTTLPPPPSHQLLNPGVSSLSEPFAARAGGQKGSGGAIQPTEEGTGPPIADPPSPHCTAQPVESVTCSCDRGWSRKDLRLLQPRRPRRLRVPPASAALRSRRSLRHHEHELSLDACQPAPQSAWASHVLHPQLPVMGTHTGV